MRCRRPPFVRPPYSFYPYSFHLPAGLYHDNDHVNAERGHVRIYVHTYTAAAAYVRMYRARRP